MIESLSRQIEENHAREDSILLKRLKEQSQNGASDIRMDTQDESEDRIFGRIVYVFRDLLMEGKGRILCKECDREMPIKELQIVQTSPFDFQKGLDKKTAKELKKELGLKKEPLRMGGMGGTAIFCGRGHELFRTIDWIA